MIDVPTDVEWDGVTATVRATFVAALDGHPRLRAGPELAARRRHENDVVHRQIVAYERHLGVAVPPFRYACTCGRSGCDDVERATTVDYRKGM